MKVVDAKRVRREGKIQVQNAVQQFFADCVEDNMDFWELLRHVLDDGSDVDLSVGDDFDDDM